jgi:O-Antigen ligase
MATVLALAGFAVLIAAAVVAVWRRPLIALYVFLVGLAAHNIVMALLFGAGVRGNALELIASWKEILLATAASRVVFDAIRVRRLPARPGPIDALALLFSGFVLLYAVLPQSTLGGHAGASAILHGLRHDLVPVVAFLLGRSLGITAGQLRRITWALLGAASAVAGFGLVEEYTVGVGWWHRSGAVGYFRDQLGFDYHGPGGMPENFAFNTGHNQLYRRLISTFVSPLGSAYMFVVSLLLVPRRRLAAPLTVLVFAALLFTISRSAVVGLGAGLVVLAVARREVWPVVAAAAVIGIGVGFGSAYSSLAPRTHFLKADLAYQQQYAKSHPGASTQVFSPNEPSWKSHLVNLRDGLETVGRHPQGYGLGNAGATAERFSVPLKAGESNYTEIGVETGLAGLVVFVAWNLALLAGLVRRAWSEPPGMLRAGAAGTAAALAAILVIAVQTDAYGIPWLGYCLWWLAGALTPAGFPFVGRVRDEDDPA